MVKFRDAWGFIEEGAKSSVLEFLEKSSESPTEFDQKSAQIAAYIILKTLVPEIAASRYLDDLREFCQSAVRDISEVNLEEVNSEISNQGFQAPSSRVRATSAKNVANDPSRSNTPNNSGCCVIS